jgi:hypothetical protein
MGAPTRQDVLGLGLPAPAAPRPPQLIESTVDGSGLLLVRAHGLATDAPLSFRAISSTTLGATPSSLPAPLAEGTTYYARPTSSDAFQVATAVSPAAVVSAFTAAAVGRFSFLVDPGTALDTAIERAWTIVQSDCTAHGGDVTAQILTDAAAALAARFYVAFVCAGDPVKAESYDGIARLYAEIYAPKLAAYFAGVPVRGATDATPSTAENGPVLVATRSLGPFGPLSTATADRWRV